MEVVIQHPADRAVAFLLVTKIGGVGVEQVVQREPAGCLLLEEVGPDQFGERGAGRRLGDGREAGRGGRGDIGAGVSPQQPEHPGSEFTQQAVGPGEHRPDIGGLVPGIQPVQAPADVSQPGGESC